MADATDKTDSEIENSPESIKDEQKDSKQKKDEIAITPQSHPANTSNQGNKIDDGASNGINTVTSNSKIDEQKTQKQEKDKNSETPKANPNNTSKQGNKSDDVASNGTKSEIPKTNPNNKQYGNVWHDPNKSFFTMIVILSIVFSIVTVVVLNMAKTTPNINSPIISPSVNGDKNNTIIVNSPHETRIKVTIRFNDEYKSHQPIEIFKGESLGNQYFEPKSPTAQFSHWDLNGKHLTKDTPIEENCTVNAVWIEKVTIHFKAQQKGLYDQDIIINKGETLGDKYYTQRHPLFQFVCWKDRNGQIVTQDTKIDKESTLYAEYKLNPAYKRLYVYNKGIFDIIKVQSNFETNSLEILTTSGEWISEDITSLYGVIYKNDKYVYYDGSSDTLNRKQFQEKLNDAMIPSDCYYIITHDESNCWLPKKLLYYYVLRNKTIFFIYLPTKPHEAGDKIEDDNPNHDQTWTRHPFCDFDGWYLSDGTKLTKETVITQDCTVRAQWKFAYLAMKVKVKEKIIYQEPAIDSKCISDYSNTQSENNEVIIVDVKQNNKKEEWGKLQSGGWIQLAQVTTILATQYKNGTWKEKKKYLIHFNLGKENGLGDSIVAVPHGKTIKEAYNYGYTYCLSEPQRLGYRFAGCYYHGKEIGYDTKIEEEYDEPIIAKWIAE